MTIQRVSKLIAKEGPTLYQRMVEMSGIPSKGGYLICHLEKDINKLFVLLYLGTPEKEVFHPSLEEMKKSSSFVKGVYKTETVQLNFTGLSDAQNKAVCAYIGFKMGLLSEEQISALSSNPYIELMMRYEQNKLIFVYITSDEMSPLPQPPENLPFSYRHVNTSTPKGLAWAFAHNVTRGPQALILGKDGDIYFRLAKGAEVTSWEELDKVFQELGYTEYSSLVAPFPDK